MVPSLLLVIFRTVAQWPLIIKGCSRDHPPQLNTHFLPFRKAPAGVLLPMRAGSWTERHPTHAPGDSQRRPPPQALPSLPKFKGTTRGSLHPGAALTQRSQVPQQIQPEARGGMGHDGAWGAWGQQDRGLGMGRGTPLPQPEPLPTLAQPWIQPTAQSYGL